MTAPLLPMFECDGFRPVVAPSATGAAKIFANRQAIREYGRRGYCRTLRLDSWTQNGATHHFQAFIGRSVPGNPGTTSGRDIWLSVHRRAIVGGAL